MFDESGEKLMMIGPGASKSHGLMAAMIGLAFSTGYDPLPYALRRSKKPYKTCLLHSCLNETNHNGGYCCSEHCKRHRVVTKILKKHNIVKSGNRFRIDWRSI